MFDSSCGKGAGLLKWQKMKPGRRALISEEACPRPQKKSPTETALTPSAVTESQNSRGWKGPLWVI